MKSCLYILALYLMISCSSKGNIDLSNRNNELNEKLGKGIELFDKKYNALKFHFLSNDNEPLKKKKINFYLWYDVESLLWLKASYNKLGTWEYRLLEVK